MNDTLRQIERRRVFNVDGLCRLAAESVNRSPDDIADLKKLAEGGFNRTFLLTMRDGFRMVARIPYPIITPKYFAVASEVATMVLLRSRGLPIPEVYGYSPTPDNAAETEYIFMDFVQGTDLYSMWYDLGEEDIISISRQLAELESKMMWIDFPAGGSLYYTKDLEKVTGGPGIPLKDDRFSIGPDTRLSLWLGRRSQLDVDRGPYKNAEAALVKGTYKELAYLEQFGRPLLPFRRLRREAYQYQEQLPSDHVKNLDRYLLIAPSLIPRNPILSYFGIRHPDLQPGNIIVDSNLHIVGLIDWQHTPILPGFLLANMPNQIQNYNDPISQSMTRPSLPENFNNLDENQQDREKELYRRRLVHYYYLENTRKYNILHYIALTDHMCVLRRRLFQYASDRWEGETHALKLALIDAMEDWEALTEGTSPCPVVFDTEDVRETRKLDVDLQEMDEIMEKLEDHIGFGPDGWVPIEHYEEVMTLCRQLKKDALAEAELEKERAEIETHWPLDDMNEEEYS